MARITVEDCIDKFPSRFELVLVASNRARKLHSGDTPTVEKDNDKNTVIALREIAQETLTAEQLKTDLIEEYQTTPLIEEDELIEDDTTSEEESLIGDQKLEGIINEEENSNSDTIASDAEIDQGSDETHNEIGQDQKESEEL